MRWWGLGVGEGAGMTAKQIERKAEHDAAVAARRQHNSDVAAQRAADRAARQAQREADRQARIDARYARNHPSTGDSPSAVSPPPPVVIDQGAAFGGGGGGGGDYPTDDVSSAGENAAPAPSSGGGGGGFHLTTKDKVWLGVGGGVLVLGWIAYRRVTAPLRKYRRVKGLVSAIVGEFK